MIIRPSDGIAVRNHGGNSSLSLLPAEDVAHPFRVTAHREVDGETVKWWLGIEPGYARYITAIIMAISDGGGNVSYGGGLAVSVDDLLTGSVLKDMKFMKVNCYKEKRYSVNNITKNQYLADGASLVFAYAQNPGGGPPKLAVTSMSTFNAYFSNGLGGYSCNPLIGIGFGGTAWRRICLNIMPIAYFDGAGKVYQYVHDTLDMVVEPITAMTSLEPYGGESDEDFMNRIGGNKKWGAYTYQTGVTGAPPGYTFDYDE